MRFNKIAVRAISYELPSERISTASLESALAPVYGQLRIPLGQLELLTGVSERRFWPPGTRVAEPSARVARLALQKANLAASEVDLLIYAGVCRDEAEPATAAAVGAALGVPAATMLYDVSNACLGMLTGILDAAVQIEAGFVQRALVVAAESARAINEETIAALLQRPDDREFFNTALATLTGGSGAVAVIIENAAAARSGGRKSARLWGAAHRNAARYHELCRWGFDKTDGGGSNGTYRQTMRTDAVKVLKHGVELGQETWRAFLGVMDWQPKDIQRVISHQIGKAHRRQMLQTLGLQEEQDLATYSLLGNMGSVSVPLSAALACERKKISNGDRVAWLGIGSGLNCLMLGFTWGDEEI